MTSGAELLERAVHLCRANAKSALLPYWIGTAPFMAALVYYCLYVTGRANAEESVPPYSLILTLLWVWMNFWHTVCCDALWRSASGEPNTEWSLRSAARVVITTTAIQGPGLAALSIAATITLPFPWVYAFLQNCHVYASRMDLPNTIRSALQQAKLWPKQSWQLLSCVLLLTIIVFLNVMLAIYLGAQLLNSFFGITTSLVQNRIAILGVPYLTTAACMTIFVIDPMWKAAHVLRCFDGESKHTGADLRLLLRRVAGLAILTFTCFQAQAQPPASSKYDRAVNEVLQRPEYEWTLQRRLDDQQRDSALQGRIQTFRRWVNNVVDWIGERFRELARQEQRSKSPAPGAGLRWTVISIVAICAATILILFWRSRTGVQRQAVAESLPGAQPVDVADESVSPDQLPADEWLQLADNLLQKGDSRLAARALYLAALAQLDAQRLVTLGRHKTNGEYQRELARRARGKPVIPSLFGTIGETFERSWYGSHSVNSERVAALKSALLEIRSHA